MNIKYFLYNDYIYIYTVRYIYIIYIYICISVFFFNFFTKNRDCSVVCLVAYINNNDI